MILRTYVDDLIITGSSKEDIGSFKEEMKKSFEMSDLGLLSYYLGIEVKQTEREIFIHQEGLIRKIL